MTAPQRELAPSRRIQAAVSLLSDDDPAVVAACKRQLLSWGEATRLPLQMATRDQDPKLRTRARALLRSLDLRGWLADVQELAQACDLPGQRMADSLLLRGALLLSAVDRDRPRTPGGVRARMPAQGIAIESRLRQLGLELGRRIAGRTTQAASKALRTLLAEENDFTGGESSYFSPASVRIDEVIDSKRGVPVSLSILYLLVARWAGLSAAGVRMPDHFLLRIHGVRPVILDPFHRGRQVTKSDCVRYLRSAGYGNSTAEYTRDLADREVLAELCRCLARAYRAKGDHEAVHALTEAQAVLEADHVFPGLG